MSDDELGLLLGLPVASQPSQTSSFGAVKPSKPLKTLKKTSVASRPVTLQPIDNQTGRNIKEDRPQSPSGDFPLLHSTESEDSDKPTKETVLTTPATSASMPAPIKAETRIYALPSDSLWMYSKPDAKLEGGNEVKEKDFAEGLDVGMKEKNGDKRQEGRKEDIKPELLAIESKLSDTALSLLDQLMDSIKMSASENTTSISDSHRTVCLLESSVAPPAHPTDEIVVKLDEGSVDMVKAPTSSTLAEGLTTADESFLTETDEKPRRRFHVSLHQSRVKGSTRRRTRYQIVRYIERSSNIRGIDQDEVKPEEIEVIPDTPFQRDVQSKFSRSALEQIIELAKIDNTSGNHLPSQLRDIFPALSDPTTAVSLANHLRRQLGLSPLSNKTDRVALRRAVAQMRLGLYTELVSAIVIPSAPEPAPDTDDEDERERRNKISLAPSAITHLQKSLPVAFPNEKYTIKLFLAHHGAFGEPKGKVVWQDGIGKMVGGDPNGPGFRGKISNEGLVHVFVDHSNVLHGLTHCLQKLQSSALPPRHLRTLSLPVLSLLLRRGRPTPHGSLHLVASSPIQQNLDPLVRLGWEVSVLKRVEIYDNELKTTQVPKPQSLSTTINMFQEGGSRRYKEQGVDEILHLKILQALNTKSTPAPKGSTIVLATGDAKGGQFNQDGFLGAVREAIKRGWMVELWSFREGMSRTWKEVKRKENWEGSFTVRVLDEWAEQLVEVGDGD